MILFTIHLFMMTDRNGIQDTIPAVTPSDGIVSGRHIPAYKNRWEMIAVYPDGSVEHRGFWNDEVSFTQDNSGREILKRKQIVEYKDHLSIQEEEVFRDNLQHKHLVIYHAGEEPHTDIYYSDHKIWGRKVFRVEGLQRVAQMPLKFSYELSTPVFDWHLWGILISGFPLEIDYRARFLAHESYSYLPGDFRWYTLHVTGIDTIDTDLWNRVACYTVDVKAEVNWKIWIAMDKSIPPVQQILIVHTDGVQLWWKPVRT